MSLRDRSARAPSCLPLTSTVIIWSMSVREDTVSSIAMPAEDEDDEPFAYERDAAPDVPPPPQVPAYIAIIRIIAVLGMGLSISFGLFIMLAGLPGVIIGVPILLLSIPCYFGMRLAERLVGADEDPTEHVDA